MKVKKEMKGILSIALSLCLIFGLFAIPMTAAADDETIQLGAPESYAVTSSGGIGTTIGFGGKQWIVIGDDDSGVYPLTDHVTLLLKSGFAIVDSTVSFGAINEYSSSNLKLAMDNAADTVPNTNEKALITSRDLAGGATSNGTNDFNVDGIAGESVSNAAFWPLSIQEAVNITGNSNGNAGVSPRIYAPNGSSNGSWSLRSPGNANVNGPINYGVVNVAGAVLLNGSTSATVTHWPRPAFNLNLSSVLFTTAATDSKSGEASDELVAASSLSNDPIKFTALDSEFDLAYVTPTEIESNTITFSYAGRASGTTLSAIVTDATGELTHYGKLDTTDTPSGSAEVTLPPGFDQSTDHLQIFAEQINGDNYTDFAGSPIEIEFPITPPIRATSAITVLPTASNIYKGDALSASILSGGIASAEAKDVAGSFDWTNPADIPVASGDQPVTFTPVNPILFTAATAPVNVSVLDKDALDSLIETATITSNTAIAGTQVGQYPQSALDALTGAIAAARTVADKVAVNNNQTDIDGAEIALRTAVSNFASAEVKVPDTTLQDNADINAALTAVQTADYNVAGSDVLKDTTQARAKIDAILAGLVKNGVTFTVHDGTFTLPTVGTASNPDGAKGSYTFTVTLSKGQGTPQTSTTQTLSLPAEKYTAEKTLEDPTPQTLEDQSEAQMKAGAQKAAEAVVMKFVPAAAGTQTTVSKKAVTVKIKAVSGAVSYKIRYKVKGTNKWKTKTVTKAQAKNGIKIKGLKSGKKYEIQYAVVKKAGAAKKNVSSKWSKSKVTKKIKK